MKQPGTLIISLDFELHWGVFESVGVNSPYMKNLIHTPAAIEMILNVFEKRKVSATWATVGFLFSESSEMLRDFEPKVKPFYGDVKSNPYLLKIGEDEVSDPLHFAPSIIKNIQATQGQEIATHSFSHFYCRASGATKEAFISDLESAIKIAEKSGVKINCIVFPRNQLIKEFIDVLNEYGISVFRGAEKGWMYSKIKFLHDRKLTKLRQYTNKLGRILDTYIPMTGSNTWGIDELNVESEKYINIPASRFVRPYNATFRKIEWLKYQRIKYQIKYAAMHGKMVHLWWHPHNFGSDIDENIKLLNKILDYFDYCRSKYGMKSMNMFEYSDILKKNRSLLQH